MSPPVVEATPGDHGHPHGSHLGSSLTFPRSASVLGYCLLPLVLVSMFGIIVPLDGLFGYLLTSLAITWCSYSSSSMFTVVGKSSLLTRFFLQTNIDRPHDFDARTGSVPHGSVLWQFWYHGHLQLAGHWSVGEGGRIIRIWSNTIQGVLTKICRTFARMRTISRTYPKINPNIASKSTFTALRCRANRSTPNVLRAMTTRTLHEIVLPDNLRHPSHLLQPYIPLLASSFRRTTISIRILTMGWFWADTAPAAPAARVAPHAMPRGSISSMEPPVRPPTPHTHTLY